MAAGRNPSALGLRPFPLTLTLSRRRGSASRTAHYFFTTARIRHTSRTDRRRGTCRSRYNAAPLGLPMMASAGHLPHATPATPCIFVVDRVGDQFGARPGRAGAIVKVRLVFVAEPAHGAQHGIGCGLAQPHRLVSRMPRPALELHHAWKRSKASTPPLVPSATGDAPGGSPACAACLPGRGCTCRSFPSG